LLSNASKRRRQQEQQQPNIIPLSGLGYMDRNMSYCLIINHIWIKSLICKYFLIVPLIVLLGLHIPLLIRLSSIWYTLLTIESTGFLSTCSNHINLFEGEKNHRGGGWIVLLKTFLSYVLKNCSQIQSLK